VKLIKNIGHVFRQLFNRGLFDWFACKNLNLVPAREARFQQIHVIDRFWVQVRERSDRGAL